MAQSAETTERLASAVRRFVREQLLPAEPKVEDDDDIPPSIVAQLKDLGLFGMTVPACRRSAAARCARWR